MRSVQNNGGLGGFEYVRRAFCRLIRVERNVGSARLHHRVHAHDQFDGTPKIERNSHFRADTDSDQISRQAIAFGVELGIGQATVTENQCFGVRCSVHLGVEQIREGCLRNDGVGVVPRLDGGRDLFVAEQSDVAYRDVRVMTDRIEHAQEAIGECRHRGLVEQIRRVGERRRHRTRLPRGDCQVEIELRRLDWGANCRDLQSG
ncbi:hypothetical protein BKP42_20710 [Rhodococcus erythropolis]|nr:hypothetical protein BKP42_20710 [Rhodococcus erythropolis]